MIDTHGEDRIRIMHETMSVQELTKRIETGRILIRAEDRELTWSQEQVIALFDSVLRGLPIGSILLWVHERPAHGPHQRRRAEGEGPANRTWTYLLDGRNRAGALSAGLGLDTGGPENPGGIHRRLYYDLEPEGPSEPRLVQRRRLGARPEPRHIPVGCLLKTHEFTEACGLIDNDVRDPVRRNRLIDEANRAAATIAHYRVPVMRIQGADQQTADTISDRINGRDQGPEATD